jgi:hypothetical protein
MVFMMSKCTFGKAHAQPFCLHSMAKQMHYITVLLVCSLAPLDSGW